MKLESAHILGCLARLSQGVQHPHILAARIKDDAAGAGDGIDADIADIAQRGRGAQPSNTHTCQKEGTKTHQKPGFESGTITRALAALNRAGPL